MSLKGKSAPATTTAPADWILCVGVFCIIGAGCRHLLRSTRVPYTVALLIVGIGIGYLGCLPCILFATFSEAAEEVGSVGFRLFSGFYLVGGNAILFPIITVPSVMLTLFVVILLAEFGTALHLGKFGDGIRLCAEFEPDLLLAVFLPPLLFEGTLSMEPQQIKQKCMVQMLLLPGPGVIISTFCIGSAVKISLPYRWSWQTSLLLGAVLSATDPVAVVALLKDLWTSKKMSTIIEGESMMNDGASIVVYYLFYNMALGKSFTWEAIVKYLSLATLGALGIGIAFGIILILWLPHVSEDPPIILSLTLGVSYLVYFVAQEVADVSGILAVVTLGMFMAVFARTTFSSDIRRGLYHSWELIAYIVNTLIFILSGIIMAEGVINSDNLYRRGSSWGNVVLVYVIVQLTRALMVVLLYPALQYFGYGLKCKEAILLAWSGLRGAVGLAMALSIKVRLFFVPWEGIQTV